MDSSNERFSPNAWKRYEPFVAEWMKSYPLPYSFVPIGLSVNTVIARLRDAVKGQIAFKWPSMIPSITLLASRWPDVVVTQDRTNPKAVRIGPKESRNTVASLTSTVLPSKVSIQVFQPTLYDLLAVAHLLNRGILTTEVQINDCPEATKAELEKALASQYLNVAIVQEQDSNFILL